MKVWANLRIVGLRLGIVTAACGFLAVGCVPDEEDEGPDCRSICDEAMDCEGAEQADCAGLCQDAEDQADRAGCRSEFDDLIDCDADLPDICNPSSDACGAESAAFTQCMQDATCDPEFDDCG